MNWEQTFPQNEHIGKIIPAGSDNYLIPSCETEHK